MRPWREISDSCTSWYPLVPPISITDMVDFKRVLNELWKVTQEEMNFIIEAGNMEEFKDEEQGRCICGYAGSF